LQQDLERPVDVLLARRTEQNNNVAEREEKLVARLEALVDRLQDGDSNG
jgi:hypothetical protein